MVDFIKTQEFEIKNLTGKIQNHFEKTSYNGKSQKRYQKLLENRMISQEYQLKDSCNVFSKKQIDEQFFMTTPNILDIQEKEKMIVNKLQQIVDENQKGQKRQSIFDSEKTYTQPSKIDDGDNLIGQRRSTNFSLNREKISHLNTEPKQNNSSFIDEDFQQQFEYGRRKSMQKNLHQRNFHSQTKVNYGKMPTLNDYQKMKVSNQNGMQTYHTNFYSTFYETPKLNEKSPYSDVQQKISSAKSKSQSLLTGQQNLFPQQLQLQKKIIEEYKPLQPSRKISFIESNNVSDKFGNLQNDENLNQESIRFGKSHNKQLSTNGFFQKNQVEENKNDLQSLSPQKKEQKTHKQKQLKDKFEQFKFINKIDLEMGKNYTFKQHMEMLKENPQTLEHFQQILNQQHLHGSGYGIPSNHNHGIDSKINLSVNSRHISSQLQSKAQLNSRINVSKTNALSSSQLSVKERQQSRRRKQDDNFNSQDQHGSSQTSSNQPAIKTGQQNNTAVIEVPSNLFLKNNKKRFSILPLQESQSVVQNFNFPLSFLASLSREESTKINTVQAFFPDFLNNLKYLEKSKQTKKRAARTLKKILGWNEKMAPLILNEDGTEIKKDLDFQTVFFEEVFRTQKQNLLKEIIQNKKDNISNGKQTQIINSDYMTLSFDTIWENFQKYQYLNKNLITFLEKKEKDLYKANRASLLEEIIDIHKMQSRQLNKFPLSNKQYQFLLSLPNNIQHILDRKNYLQKEQALDSLEVSELNYGQFPYLLQFERIRSKYINLCNQVIRNYEKYV